MGYIQVSEYGQEMPQSHSADPLTAPRRRDKEHTQRHDC